MPTDQQGFNGIIPGDTSNFTDQFRKPTDDNVGKEAQHDYDSKAIEGDTNLQRKYTGESEPVEMDGLKSDAIKPLSFGEKLVGITFNPSNDGEVNLIKTKFAELANLIHDRNKTQETSVLSKIVYDSSIQSLLTAQMNAVKFVTLKY